VHKGRGKTVEMQREVRREGLPFELQSNPNAPLQTIGWAEAQAQAGNNCSGLEIQTLVLEANAKGDEGVFARRDDRKAQYREDMGCVVRTFFLYKPNPARRSLGRGHERYEVLPTLSAPLHSTSTSCKAPSKDIPRSSPVRRLLCPARTRYTGIHW
jgi:hypothetical protein